MSNNTAQAFETIKSAMQEDPGYAWGWHCNIAMAAVDSGVGRIKANQSAAEFMRRCFGVEPACPIPQEPTGE